MQLRLIVLLSLFVVTGCTRSEIHTENSSPSPASSPAASSPEQRTTAAASPQVKPKLDACAMLTSKDIESVQGEAVKETKLSESSANGFNVTQCFFTLSTFTNSISLVITQRAEGPGVRDPKQFWKENFHQDNDREKDRRKEEGEESRPPQKISGIGDEAFWMSSRAAGILYVLKGSSYIRISIGGSGDQQTKIRKSKALAQKVIDRL